MGDHIKGTVGGSNPTPFMTIGNVIKMFVYAKIFKKICVQYI